MLVTRTPGGALRARPMVVAKIEDNGDVLVATSLRSEKAPEIEAEPQVALTFQFAMACVTVCGPARIVADCAAFDGMCGEAMRVCFPSGTDDSALCLVLVRPVSGEYWDVRGMRKIRTLYEAKRASSSGVTRSPSWASAWVSDS